MASATITSKGQVTIPREIREALHLEPGDRIAFRREDDGTVVVEPETVDIRSLRGVLKPRVRGVRLEDMEAAIRRGGTRK